MTHLTDDQLSALLDDALGPAERADADSHLSSCEVCRAKLSHLAALDRSLGAALTHDPGEAYFATFAERVSARIAAGESKPAAATAAPAARRSSWAWLLSPRGLSLAGGMAALLLTAGIAWLRFQHEDAASALRAAAPSAIGSLTNRQAAPAPRLAIEDSAAPAPAATPPSLREERSQKAAADAGSLRAREMKTLANGEPVPVGTSTRRSDAAAPLPAAAPAPATAQMKRQAMAKQFVTAPPPSASTARPQVPAPSAAAEKDALAPRDAVGSASRSLDARNEAQARGGVSSGISSEELKLQLAQPTPLAVQCGTVTDTRGTALRGVQIMLLGASTRSARSGPDGSFCLPQAVVGDTLIVMHVGFEPVRVVLTASSSLAFGLEPIGTLGPRAGLVPGAKTEGLLKIPSPASAPAPDVYATAPDAVRAAVAQARARTAVARRDRSADAWEAAAASWDGIAAMLPGHAGFDARFQSLSALREAWRIGPTPARAERLRSGLAAFVAATPRTLPERATAVRWQGELGFPTFH